MDLEASAASPSPSSGAKKTGTPPKKKKPRMSGGEAPGRMASVDLLGRDYGGAESPSDILAGAAPPLEATVTGGRFPFADSFDLGGTCLSAAEVKEMLGPFIEEGRKETFDNVARLRTYNLLPIVENLHDKGNIAAVCRSAEALGIGHIHIVAPRGAKYKKTQPITKSGRTSAGSEKWLHVKQFPTTEECLSAAKEAGYQIVVTALDPESVPLSAIDFSKPTAFVLGNEVMGVSDEAKSMADHKAIIPMSGFVESFNISVAGALIMYHAYLDRMTKLGRHGDLTESELEVVLAVLYLRHNAANHGILKKLTGKKGQKQKEVETRAFGGGALSDLGLAVVEFSQSEETAEALLGVRAEDVEAAEAKKRQNIENARASHHKPWWGGEGGK